MGRMESTTIIRDSINKETGMKPARSILAAALLAAGSTAWAQAPGYDSAVIKVECDYDCLLEYARNYIEALADRDYSRARLAPDVIFAENNVVMPVGNDGLW